MFKYTTYPLEDLQPSHFGFYGWLVFSIIVLLIVVWSNSHKDKDGKIILLFLLVSCLGSYFISFHMGTQSVKKFENTKLVGTFVRFVAEGFSEEKWSGKYRSRADVHLQFAEYEVDGGRVIVKAKVNEKAHPRIYFYKNQVDDSYLDLK